MTEWFSMESDDQILLLLDGFNEVPTKELQSELSASVRHLASKNDKIRFIITSRYDMKNCFFIGSQSAVEYSANMLSSNSIKQYIDIFFAGNPNRTKILKNVMAPGKKDHVKEFLKTPMALIMYCLVNSPDLKNSPIDDLQTYGDLMTKYIEKIKAGNAKEGEEKEGASLSNVEKLLRCAGYYMTDKGVFNFYPKDFKDFVADAEFKELIECFDKLKNHIFFKDIIKCEKDGSLEFRHQNYRDFFAASFLREILVEYGPDEINKYFGTNIISQEVMVLLADILNEYRYKNESVNSAIQNRLDNIDKAELTSPAISQIIRVAAIGRNNDLSLFNFSELDLSDTSLNSIKLYKNNKITANFEDAVIKKYTLNALGQPGAVFSMLWVEKRFLVSFSKLGFFCFDMKIRKHYRITDYPEYAVRAALLLNKQFILTGDDNGKITLWSYEINYDVFHIKEEAREFLQCSGTASTKVLDVVEFDDKIFVSTEGGGVWSLQAEGCRLTVPHNEKISFNIEKSKSFPCRLTFKGDNLYCSFGNVIKKLTRGDAVFFDYYKVNSGKIIDIAAVELGFGEVMLINIEITGDKGSSSSKVIAVKKQKEYPVTDRTHEGRTGFKGWNSFCETSSNEVYLAANIEDSPESAGLLKISSDSNSEYLGVDYFGNRHSMSVNCAVCFNYNTKEYIATGSTERSVEILEAQGDGGTLLYHLDGHDNGIHYIDVVSDEVIYAAHYSGEVSKWMECGDGWRCMQVWAPHDNWVWECRYVSIKNEGYVISCSYDNKLSVISERTGETLMITEPVSRVLSFGFLSDDTILTGYNDIDGKTVLRAFKIDFSNCSYISLPEIKTLGEMKYDLRSIHTVKEGEKKRLLLCANNKDSNKPGTVFSICEGQDKLDKVWEISEENKRVIIRYIDEISFDDKTIMACGGDYSDESVRNAFCVIISDYNDKDIPVFIDSADGCSSLRLVKYDGKLYFVAGNYSGHIYIYIIDLEMRKAKRAYIYPSLNDKVLNLQYRDGKVFFSTLNGKVYSLSFKDAVSGNAVPEKIFQAISGLRCCYVDFTNINRNKSKLPEDFREIMGYYGKV